MESARSSVDAMGFGGHGFCVVRVFMCMYPLKQCELTRILSEAEFDHNNLMGEREGKLYIFTCVM